LEGNLIASDKIPECLWSRQSARTGFAIKDHNTIRSREHLQWTEWINNTNSVLTSFFISLHLRWIFLQTAVRTVGKGVVIDWYWGGGSWRWVWGEHWGETATGGDDFMVIRDVQTKIMRTCPWDWWESRVKKSRCVQSWGTTVKVI
jgi:hypothetical protein